MTDAEEWQHWTEARTAAVSAPHGPLALTATHWLEPEPSALPDLPGRWWASDGAEALVRLAAETADGIRLERSDTPVSGEVALRPDSHPTPDLLTVGARRLVPIDREGELALRVFDPDSPARAGFVGLTVYPYAPDWAVPAVFTPFEDRQAVLVPNADGRERPLETAGRVAFHLAGEPYTLTVSAASGERLSGVIADATSGHETYRFRFITLPAPDAEGRTVLDFNRAYLPPCAFADHFVCPFPPPGNRLPLAVEAGEKQVVWG